MTREGNVSSHSDEVEAPRWLDAREQRAWRGFLGMYAQIQEDLRRQLLRDTGMSVTDYGVLVCLSEAPDGELRSFQLGEELQWEASRLSHQLRRMEGRGLVTRRSCGDDGRGMTTSITTAGRQAIESAAPRHVAEVRRVFIDVLDDGQLDALIAAADAVTDVLATTPDSPE